MTLTLLPNGHPSEAVSNSPRWANSAQWFSRMQQPFCGNLSRRVVAAVIFAWRGPRPSAKRCSIRLEDFNLERVARCNIARMCRAAVAAGTSRQSSKQIYLREKLDEVAGANRACFHEVLVRVLCKSGAHEDIKHVMDMMFHRARFRLQFGGKRGTGWNGSRNCSWRHSIRDLYTDHSACR